MAEQWKLEGTYMEACNCKEACPCVFLSPPSEGECTALLAWHIDSGLMGDVDLSGLNAALSVYSPGNMIEGNWTVAMYVDDQASEEQRQALQTILGGQVGGHPANLAELIGEILGVRAVPVQFETDGKRHTLRIGEVGEATTNDEAGTDGREVTVNNPPFSVAPGFPLVLTRSQNLRYRDYDYDWEISERNGFISPFAYAGPGA